MRKSAFCLIITLIFILGLSNIGLAKRWYADANNPYPGNGKSWGQAFTTIQEAIDAAIEGDEVWVAMGTYALDSTINVDKAVAIYGGFAGWETEKDQRDWIANVTTVDGQDIIRCFYLTADALLDGFTVTGGNTGPVASFDWFTVTSGHDHSYFYGGYAGCENEKDQRDLLKNLTALNNEGGGIFVDSSSPKINNCIIIENQGRPGGGMYNYQSSPSISNCQFIRNRGLPFGGGILNLDSYPSINNCTFTENLSSWHGGGIYSWGGETVINNCSFSENISENDVGIGIADGKATVTYCELSRNYAWDWGGGIGIARSSVNVSNCTFSENDADRGGGILVIEGEVTISSCIFIRNNAYFYGGGIYSREGDAVITNCIFFENTSLWPPPYASGGGIYYENGSQLITNCTFYANQANWRGGGLYVSTESSSIVTNSVFWDNTVDSTGEGPQIYEESPSTSTVSYSNIQEGYPGEGNMDAVPQFVDPNSGDFHLSLWSPCIDVGTDSAELPETDFEGDPRIGGSGPDMGADEFFVHVEIDIKPGANPNSINLKSNGLIPVAVLTTEDFDASVIDPDTCLFADAEPERWTMEDVDDDGDLDMLFHWRTQDLNLNEDSTEAMFEGETTDGDPVASTDTVNIVRANP